MIEIWLKSLRKKLRYSPILNDSKVTKLKVLEIQWDYQDNSLSVESAWMTEFLKRKKNTKRFVLQTAGKTYNPLGLLTLFTVRLKFLLQKLWLMKLPWDTHLPSDLNASDLIGAKNF
ncbi:hypothetical protein NPIL_253641 [Nephila pilipes]|uniref:Uncharacterized protein n=1 Tax=Nephila pilipes TaxID=299642 RepID=A0A8X6TY83_NEPPI|nr:hypothetical protein NPIL_253641 [Nephila pilipes]